MPRRPCWTGGALGLVLCLASPLLAQTATKQRALDEVFDPQIETDREEQDAGPLRPWRRIFSRRRVEEDATISSLPGERSFEPAARRSRSSDPALEEAPRPPQPSRVRRDASLDAVSVKPASQQKAVEPAPAARAEEPPAIPQEKAPAPRALGPPAEDAEETPSILEGRVYPLDLPTSLRLAGVRNAEVLFSRARISEADAARQLAAAQLLPDINAGTNYDKHVGPLQRANGQIIEVNRSSLYGGLGASAVGGGTVTIPGIVWNANVSETFFGILVNQQIVSEREFAAAAIRNDVLLRVASGYVELLRAEGRRAIAIVTRDDARELARVTANYARVGQGREADADRAATELQRRTADVFESEAEVMTASARLCQLLDLDPACRLHAADGWVVPIQVVPNPAPLCELIAIAVTQRPELGERRAAIRQALLVLDGAQLLPFSPNVIVGYSTGQFGGGSNLTDTRWGHFDDREDFDAVAYWTLQNLGVGNIAQVRLARSRVRASSYRQLEVLDRVRMEVAVAHARTKARYAQIGTGERAVESAVRGFKADLLRTRNREGLPIEVLNSLNLLARSRQAYLDAICDYNRAEFELFVSLGQPPADVLAQPVPKKLMQERSDTQPAPPAEKAQP